ncbi:MULTISPECIES: hypothetical protein [Janthinobacterium]|uniref:hypothetical protein n=1 Tax=Janthinobacterium TaxID=29580 RepID=UPI00087576E2|nr:MULTISPECIES: hypothetical protein [Janthinobacterium]MCC7695584.1 hypothetical protein [Janthinobacterium sp. EB271-G4-7A]MCC7713819.1 hypothetical protein [Janthinobacterium lividum]OEZ61871.1 hypothetical protein JANLI_10980 [Janthinobacterium lividum]WQE28234.1 hypothetical protein U0004_25180 [Janthinobacterium lividum]STQ99172.1 Uncharacterised protein [Janthinobacterium lividum]
MPSYTVLLAIEALILFFAMLARRQAGKLRLAFRDAIAPTQQALHADVEQLLAQKTDVVSV